MQKSEKSFIDFLKKEHKSSMRNGGKAKMGNAFLINEGDNERHKFSYIKNAEAGIIVAFRLNFESKSGVKLTKVISGKILENSAGKELCVVETRNGIKYGVPYEAVVWVKTGERWPRGVYEEMKQGAVRVNAEDDDETVLIEFTKA